MFGVPRELGLILRSTAKSLHHVTCRCNTNRAAVTHTKRAMYVRQYPTMIVLPNGATIQARYKEPRKIVKLPIDVTTLSPEELEALKKRRRPKKVYVQEVEVEDNFDRKKYAKFFKKK